MTEAHTEALEAAALAAELEERILNGDETVSPEELDAARKLAEFATLRATAAERRAFEAAKEAAAEELERASAQVKAMVLARTDHIAALEKKAAKALEACLEAAEARWAKARIVSRRLRIANEEAAKYGLASSKEAHGVFDDGRRIAAYDSDGRVRDYTWAREVDPTYIVANVINPARLAYRSHSTRIASSRPTPDVDYENGPGSRAADEQTE